jgi:subtilisin family serine protease
MLTGAAGERLLIGAAGELHTAYSHTKIWLSTADLKLCEPDQNVELQVASKTPSDPLLSQQWALDLISVPKAWEANGFGSKDVRVCMVDTGFDYFHPDLAANVWTNTNEIPNNGIDDDNNGDFAGFESCILLGHSSPGSYWLWMLCWGLQALSLNIRSVCIVCIAT